jgi:site-specific recombinase XerD
MSEVLIIEFTEHLKQNNKSTSTIIAYAKDLQQLHQVAGKDLDLLSVTELIAAVDKFKNSKEFTSKTVSRKINSFRTFYKYLHNQGKIAANPAMEITHPKFKPKQVRVLSQPEYLALRETTRDNERLFAMVELMLQTGIRISELSKLKLADVHIDGKTTYLHIGAYSTNEAREVPLNTRATALLKKYVEQLKDQPTERPLFATRDGKPLIIRNIRSVIDRAMSKAGISDACVNDLRNTFIVAQLSAGAPLDLVAHAVGHRSKLTTKKYLDLLDKKYKPNGNSKLVDL